MPGAHVPRRSWSALLALFPAMMKAKTMRAMMKSDFFWRFVGGFAIGAVGVIALQPASAEHHVAAAASATPTSGLVR